MSDRSALLQEKRIALQELLDEVCRMEDTLFPGERLVVSIIILPRMEHEGVPEEFLAMKTREFFTPKRFAEAGVPNKGYLPRIAHLWSHEEYIMTHGGERPPWVNEDVATIREVLGLGREGLRKHGIHREGIRAIVHIFAHYGISF